MSEFGIAIREARLGMNLSIRELARRIKKTASYLSRIENDICPPPSAEVVDLLVKALDEDRDRFFYLAGRIDPELKTYAIKTLPQVENALKFVGFIDSYVMRNDDDPLGGIQGILEIMIGESLYKNVQFSTFEVFKYIANLMQELSSQDTDSLPESIILKKKIGALLLGSFSSVAQNGHKAMDELSEQIAKIVHKLRCIDAQESQDENNGCT